MLIFVPPNPRFAPRRSIRMADLQDEPMIFREEGSTTRKAFDDALRRAKVRPRMAMEIGSREAIREAVIMGVGIAAVSEIEYVPGPNIRQVAVSDAQMFTYAHVFCLRERREARLVKAFLQIVDGLLRRGRPAARSRAKRPIS
jgi:DNA-binding transcriptional LysR family regulator